MENSTTSNKPQNQGTKLRWLIIEDALFNSSGHWFEYISTFKKGLNALGDEVTILADQNVHEYIQTSLNAQPVLPQSIWHRMSDGAGILSRYLRVPIHAWQTICTIKRYLTSNCNYDVIFVPTILVHHLLGWTWLVKRVLKQSSPKLILFFPNTPVSYDISTQTASWIASPTTQLLRWLINQLKTEVQKGKVILGAETHVMQQALTHLTGVTFTYFPHPVLPVPRSSQELSLSPQLVMGSYGGARYEKGSDILFKAVAEFSDRFPDSEVQFILQCLKGFEQERELLQDNPFITWITEYFQNDEYAKYLGETKILMLPYRPSSYALRVSRVVIEAMVNGIPIITTKETTLAEQSKKFGSVILCEPENPSSLADAIFQSVENYESLKARAEEMAKRSQEHFSVQYFRECFLNSGENQSMTSP